MRSSKSSASGAPVRAVPFTSTSGWRRLNVTGRSAAFSRASAVSRTGAEANMSGCLPGTIRPSSSPVSATLPLSPDTSRAICAIFTSAAFKASIRACPVISGLLNVPWTCALTATDCHDRSGRGCIAGAVALSSISADSLVRSRLPFALADSGPACTSSPVVRCLRGPCTSAVMSIGPIPGIPTTRETGPPAASCNASCACRPVGVTEPSSLMLPWLLPIIVAVRVPLC